MVDPVAVVVEFLSSSGAINLRSAISGLSPVSGYDYLDHIQGGSDLPEGWRIDLRGPVVLVQNRPMAGGFATEDVPILNASIVTQSYAAIEEDASKVAWAIIGDLHEKASGSFTYARADGSPQIIPDRSSQWRIGLVYFTIRIRLR